jgi:adenylyltransferase/sulfurtransferase
VIGAGGLGSPAALYLAAAGVGTLGVVDCDRVEVSNLQRQVLFDTQDVGQLKAEAARERLQALNPDITIVAHPVELRAANVREVLGGYDVILDGTDRLNTRYLVNDACVLLRKPLVSAAIHRFEGQAMTYVPGPIASDQAAPEQLAPCYRCLFPEAPEGLVPTCAQAGVLGVLPGVLGAIQATEALKLVVGIGEPLVGRLLVYDALEMRFREFPFARRPECAVCGDQPAITEPQDGDQVCEDAIRRLTARQLEPLLQAASLRGGSQGRPPPGVRSMSAEQGPAGAGQAVVLIDVREPAEYAAGHLQGAVNIPVGDLPRRIGEIPREPTAVFMCRSGGRSAAACRIAVRAGFEAPINLEGGLLAWAAEVDSTLNVAPSG